MGSKSSKSSTSSSDSSRGSVYNYGESNVTEKIEEHESPTGHKFYLTSISYYYKTVGSHRIIQLELDCNSCSDGWYIYMDKTNDASKNIDIDTKDFYSYMNTNDNWMCWYYKVKKNKYFDYSDCLKLYHGAPSGYHYTKNNCADFARYIWKNAPY